MGGIDGAVEEVGLRRMVLRDTQGTVHSVSNGTIRVSSNLTRIYAVTMVDIEGVRHRDVAAVIAIMDRAGKEMAADPAWVDLIVDPPHARSTPAFTDLGVVLRMSTMVRARDAGRCPRRSGARWRSRYRPPASVSTDGSARARRRPPGDDASGAGAQPSA